LLVEAGDRRTPASFGFPGCCSRLFSLLPESYCRSITAQAHQTKPEPGTTPPYATEMSQNVYAMSVPALQDGVVHDYWPGHASPPEASFQPRAWVPPFDGFSFKVSGHRYGTSTPTSVSSAPRRAPP
jgi:hypothetical protein